MIFQIQNSEQKLRKLFELQEINHFGAFKVVLYSNLRLDFQNSKW